MSLERLSPDQLFDTPTRLAHVNKLREDLQLPEYITSTPTQDTRQRPTAGIEIEMSWRQAFEDMHERWLYSSDSPRDYDMDSEEYREFYKGYKRNDHRLRPLLQTITPVIPRVGFDAYWEFSFRPTKDATVADAELSTLYDAGILFEDIPYPTHMTIANIPSDRDASAILCLLEQAGGTTPKRIDAARTAMKGSWAQKGLGGQRKRTADELEGKDTSAYEFRTLVTTSPEQMHKLFQLGQELAHTCLTHPLAWRHTRDTVEDSLRSQGLPLKLWDAPKEDAAPWQTYSEHFLEQELLADTQKESA